MGGKCRALHCNNGDFVAKFLSAVMGGDATLPKLLCDFLLVQSVLHVVATTVISSSPSSSPAVSSVPAAAAAAAGTGRIAPSMRRREFYCEEIDQRTKVHAATFILLIQLLRHPFNGLFSGRPG